MDGGKVALSGFLHQMLMAGGLKAFAELSDEGETDNEKESQVNVLVAFARSGSIIHEAFDQDLALVSKLKEKEVLLVQVKFGGSPIYPSELKKIIASFRSAVKKTVDQIGIKPVQFCIVTNRKIAEGSREEIEALVAAKDEIATKLLLIERDFTTWVNAMKLFAFRHGTLEGEFRLDSLLGKVFQKAGYSQAGEITSADLRECLAGHQNAKQLDRVSLRKYVLDQLQRCIAVTPGRHVVREQVRTVQRDAQDRALIVFIGDGGTGKTASLRAWMEELANSIDARTPAIASDGASTVPSTWIQKLVCEWRGGFHAVDHDADVALDRLVIANPEMPLPLLHLSLDGLDEPWPIGEAFQHCRQLLEWFYREDQKRKMGTPPRARLVITCRRPDDLATIWPGYDRSGFNNRQEKLFACVHFGDFTESEFCEAVRTNLSEGQRARLGIPDTNLINDINDSQWILGSPIPESITNRELIIALHDPVLWGAFLDLSEEDREAALSAHEYALRLIGERLVNRCVQKISARKSWPKPHVLTNLRSIAVHLPDADAMGYSHADWYRAGEIAGADPHCIEPLLHEVESGGLIRRPVRQSRWQWRHRYVAEYLMAKDLGL